MRSPFRRFALLWALSAGAAFGGDDGAARLKEVERKIEQAEKEAKSIADEAEGVLGEIDGLDRSIAAREKRVREIAAEAKAAEARRDEAQRRVDELDAALPDLRARFAARARGLYRLARRGLGPVVFQAPRDWSGSVRYRRGLEAVLAHDHAIVADLRHNRGEAEHAREEAEAEAVTAKSRREDGERELQSLRSDREAKQTMLASLRGESEKRARLLVELKSSAEKLHDLIDKQEASRAEPFEPPPGAQKARMLSPLRVGAQAMTAARNGIELRVPPRTPVHAVKAGRVVFAGWFAGYGQMVILDHGDHLYSIYGYASDLLVETGQVVEAGQAIAAVGTTGPVSQSSLYFEIRDHGAPRDPAAYIPALAHR